MDVTTLWWLSLAIFAAVVVVVAVLLGMIIAAAKSIDRHAAAVWTAGKQLAGNTVSIWLLEGANDRLAEMRADVEEMTSRIRSLEETLSALAGGARR